MLAKNWLQKSICKHCNHINGLVQERRNSIANAMELRLSNTNPLKWLITHYQDTKIEDIGQFVFQDTCLCQPDWFNITAIIHEWNEYTGVPFTNMKQL